MNEERKPRWEWGIKPKEEFKVGDWVVFPYGNPFRYNELCNNRMDLVKATKQEVLNSQEYDGSATGEDFPFEEGDIIVNKSNSGWCGGKGRGVFKIEGSSIAKCLTSNAKYNNCFYAKRQVVEKYNREVGNTNEIELKHDIVLETMPISWEDRDTIRDKWVKSKDSGYEIKVTGFEGDKKNWIVCGDKKITPEHLFTYYTFLDGTACGVQKPIKIHK